MQEDRERWMWLVEQAANEQDPIRLSELVREILEILEKKQQQLDKLRISPSETKSLRNETSLNLFLVRPLGACACYLLSLVPQTLNAFADCFLKCPRNGMGFNRVVTDNKVCGQTSDGVFQGLGLPNLARTVARRTKRDAQVKTVASSALVGR